MKVLIATDGSVHSRKAIEEFCRMFEKADGLDIKIASTYESEIPLEAFGLIAQKAANIYPALEENAMQAVAEAKNYISERLPQAHVETEVGMDLAERFILEEAAEWQPNMIVVGSHGRGFWGRMTLGSVSDSVLHHAPCPVLIARSKLNN
jgi:nucleotide-binding universal stress UspA family protein